MMSTISPIFSSEPDLATSVPAFETRFTPWEISHHFHSSVDQIPASPQDYDSPGSSEPVENTDERINERKLSNRESAKRSRMKKQKYLEEMNIQLNQLKIENRDLTSQLRYVLYHCERTNTENDRLRLEHRILQEKLLNLRQVLMLIRQIERSSNCATSPCHNTTLVTVQQEPSYLLNHVLV